MFRLKWGVGGAFGWVDAFGSWVQIALQPPRKDLGQVLHVAAVTKCVSLSVNGLPTD